MTLGIARGPESDLRRHAPRPKSAPSRGPARDQTFEDEDENEYARTIWDALRQTAAHRFQQRFDRLDRLIPHIRNPETLPFDFPVTAIDLETEFIP